MSETVDHTIEEIVLAMSKMTAEHEKDTKNKQFIRDLDNMLENNKVYEILGFPGKMLSASKSAYAAARKDHEVYFNACVFDSNKVQIWYGDLDLTLDSKKLKEVANEIGTIFVTPEHPFRFDGFEKGMELNSTRVRTFTGG